MFGNLYFYQFLEETDKKHFNGGGNTELTECNKSSENYAHHPHIGNIFSTVLLRRMRLVLFNLFQRVNKHKSYPEDPVNPVKKIAFIR